jgi:hypothetical protein
MRPGLPPKIPPTPRQAAELRARRRARIVSALVWLLAILPLVFLVMAYGYSDQAPAALRNFTIALDSLFGSPVWLILNPAGAR